jgi:hypothetical protein
MQGLGIKLFYSIIQLNLLVVVAGALQLRQHGRTAKWKQ